MDEFIRTWWPIAWAGGITLVQACHLLFSQTYARKNDLETLRVQVSHMPNHKEINDLKSELGLIRVELQDVRSTMQANNNLVQLMIERQLTKEEK